MKFQRWIEALLELFFPRLCVVCEGRLAEGEDSLCALCNMRLPRTNLHLRTDHEVEKMFWGKVHLERATSFFYYRKGSDYNRLIHRLKYYGGKDLGEAMGRMVARELQEGDFFAGIDGVVPVPLHPLREKERGYNQSERIARGISLITGIPCRTDLVKRIIYTETQVHQSVFDRLENTENVFEWADCTALSGMHFLLVDDVLTTASTLVSCLSEIPKESGVRISVLTLCVAH